MVQPLNLRDYQASLIQSVRDAMVRNRRVLAVAPTGAGKTVVFSEITRRTQLKGSRIYLVAHRSEIIDQISRALHRLGVEHGVIAPGFPFRSHTPVQVGMVQSIANRLDKLAAPALLVVDEAHHATAGTYSKLVAAWPDCFILGVTATPARTDGRGLAEVFDQMVLGPRMGALIAAGYLSGYRYLAPPQQVDLSQVKTVAGDYNAGQLFDVMNRVEVTGDAEEHYRTHLNGAPAIAFCVSVAHAESVARMFTARGWKAASVDGSMDPGERRNRIAAIGNGGLNVLSSCDIVSEGTDIPSVQGAILLRPTQSLIVYLQQVGRVLRPKEDGSRAIILDHVGNVLRHGMPDHDHEWTLEGRQKRAASISVRQCPECYAAFQPQPKCPECGYIFPLAKARPVEEEKPPAPGQLQDITAAGVLDQRKTRFDQLKVQAWRTGNAAQAMDLFKQLGELMGYQPKWHYFQMAAWRKTRGNRKAAPAAAQASA